jgi:hypothetical protein
MQLKSIYFELQGFILRLGHKFHNLIRMFYRYSCIEIKFAT